MSEANQNTETRSFVRYLALTAGVVVVGLVGYLGFVVYPGLDLSAGVGVGLIALAAAAGIASFFSPCSFPLLVGMPLTPVAVFEGKIAASNMLKKHHGRPRLRRCPHGGVHDPSTRTGRTARRRRPSERHRTRLRSRDTSGWYSN